MSAQTRRHQLRPLRKVAEPVRERETLKYYSTLLTTGEANQTGAPTETSELCSSSDVMLTALAQAGAFQTGTDRSLVSLFDADYQYIVAESSPTSRLQPSVRSQDCHEPLWLCGTAIPRSHGVCELSLLGEPANDGDGAVRESLTDAEELPLTLADDLVLDPRFCSKPYCQPGTLCRFYAAVPIRTRRGINIGVYCVINETPGKVWSDEYTQRLRDISHTIMEHLEAKRLGDLHRRNQRMIQGLGSFIEGQSTISGWKSGPNVAAFADRPELEGALNSRQQSLQTQHTYKLGEQPEEARDSAAPSPTSISASILGHSSSSDVEPENKQSEGSYDMPLVILSRSEDENGVPDDRGEIDVMSKAANIVRESTEVEGCVIFDATAEAYEVQPRTTPGNFSTRQLDATSSSDENCYSTAGKQHWSYCNVLGYSTSDSSSIDGAMSKQLSTALPCRFLAKLLRRYPQGKIFNFGVDGELQSSESSEEDRTYSSSKMTEKPSLPWKDGDATTVASTLDKTPKNPWARHREAQLLLKAFPGARSVAFAPIWDPRKDRWYAGGFIYTFRPARIFTVEGELSYLTAFGRLSMAEIIRFSELLANKEKSNILGSISHELRSPLHGIILNAELLIDTKLSVFQGDIAHTIEICSRTLADTIDHLLDYSKISHFAEKGFQMEPTEASRASKRNSIVGSPGQVMKAGLSCSCRVDGLVEDVVESVFAGHTFQHLTNKRSSSRPKSADNFHTASPLDSVLTTRGEADANSRAVSVVLSIDARRDWACFIQVGAVRRVVMNLVGNALKYTDRGTIKVSLTQEVTFTNRQKKNKQRSIKFTIQDTGKGIGSEFLRHQVYKPFSQENTLSPGTGLGLSLVKQIVKQLRGEVSIDSRVGLGTTVSVTLPLQQVQQSNDDVRFFSDEDKLFDEQVRDLKGLRIRLSLSRGHLDGGNPDWQTVVADTCRSWLQMEVISDASEAKPDLVLWSQEAVPTESDFEALTKTPNVVICSNSLEAYRQSKSLEAAKHAAICEFISQPAGPRKLARALILAYTRWMHRPDSPRRPYSTPVPSSHGPNGVGRTPSPSAHSNIGGPPLNFTSSLACKADTTGVDDDETSAWFGSEQSVSSGSNIGGESSTSPAEIREPSGRFLLVDDNSINLKMLAMYMTKLDVQFDMATNGKEAVDLFCLAAGRYVCVLMDISMPVMDGFEATKCIRAHERDGKRQPTPIIALSGLASEDAHEEAMRSGMNVFLTKPVKFKTLGSMLESMGIIDR